MMVKLYYVYSCFVIIIILPVFWLIYTNYVVLKMKYEFGLELHQLEREAESFYRHLEVKKTLLEKIPKRFHFIWISPFLNETNQLNVDLKVRGNIQTCLDVHPNWDYIIWTDDLVRKVFPEFIELLIAANTPSVISDVLRVNIIARYGGIYMDTDFLCVRSFEPFLDKQYCPAFAGSAHANIDNDVKLIVSNGLIGAVQGHDLFRQTAKLILNQALKPEEPNVKTGPYFLGKMVRTYNTSTECIYVYNKHLFYQCDFNQRGTCHTKLAEYKEDSSIYAIHLWNASWVIGLD